MEDCFAKGSSQKRQLLIAKKGSKSSLLCLNNGPEEAIMTLKKSLKSEIDKEATRKIILPSKKSVFGTSQEPKIGKTALPKTSDLRPQSPSLKTFIYSGKVASNSKTSAANFSRFKTHPSSPSYRPNENCSNFAKQTQFLTQAHLETQGPSDSQTQIESKSLHCSSHPKISSKNRFDAKYHYVSQPRSESPLELQPQSDFNPLLGIESQYASQLTPASHQAADPQYLYCSQPPSNSHSPSPSLSAFDRLLSNIKVRRETSPSHIATTTLVFFSSQTPDPVPRSSKIQAKTPCLQAKSPPLSPFNKLNSLLRLKQPSPFNTQETPTRFPLKPCINTKAPPSSPMISKPVKVLRKAGLRTETRN
mgnify:CR=1 FL=1